ncbi:hypothetical protein SAMN05421644_15012 [Allochromatium warmingii]|uniref:Uncharacterized protein n=1 Tax=Allochromatium warmingii TaxID=61595 RepID=A0A1H3J0Q1_ALLWA|nr:hypothetical protein [Allochromatium warmingii]SDY33129.1 hypothetical protein SAMN05421644_15012 [Allochromatium warmingii]
MSTIPNAYCEIIDPLIQIARGFVEAGESLASVAFVGNLSSGQNLAVPIDTSTPETKNRSAALIRQIADEYEADFVFTMMEAWTLPPRLAPRFQDIIDRYGSIGASPHRVDSVAFTLETHHGIWLAQRELKPKGHSKRRKTFELSYSA